MLCKSVNRKTTFIITLITLCLLLQGCIWMFIQDNRRKFHKDNVVLISNIEKLSFGEEEVYTFMGIKLLEPNTHDWMIEMGGKKVLISDCTIESIKPYASQCGNSSNQSYYCIDYDSDGDTDYTFVIVENRLSYFSLENKVPFWNPDGKKYILPMTRKEVNKLLGKPDKIENYFSGTL